MKFNLSKEKQEHIVYILAKLYCVVSVLNLIVTIAQKIVDHKKFNK